MERFDPMELLKRVAPLSRTLVHDDNSVALEMFGAVLPDMTVEAYRSGTAVWTWRVPKKWRRWSRVLKMPEPASCCGTVSPIRWQR